MIDKFIYGFIDRVYGAEDYTQQEINAKLIQKMDDVIENCNNAFEFVDWLKEQGVPDEVQTIIDTMLEDGTIENLINTEIIENLRTEINELKSFKDEVTTKLKEINTEINNLNTFKDETNTKLNEINTEITNIKNSINSSQSTENNG